MITWRPHLSRRHAQHITNYSWSIRTGANTHERAAGDFDRFEKGAIFFRGSVIRVQGHGAGRSPLTKTPAGVRQPARTFGSWRSSGADMKP
jgi:hypothetical protein